MKKLNNKQIKEIKAGKLSGAIFGGIANCIKSVFVGIVGIVDSICGWVMGFKEAGKHHDKMNLKVGDSSMNYDDSTSIKADHDLDMQKIKQTKPGEVKPEKITYESLKEIHDDGTGQSHSTYHSVDTDVLGTTDLHVVDDFIHF